MTVDEVIASPNTAVTTPRNTEADITPKKRRTKRKRGTPKIYKLFDYQEDAVSACLTHFASERTRIAVSSPTGSGKTTMMLSVIQRMWDKLDEDAPRNVLIIVPSIQLAGQISLSAKDYFIRHLKQSITVEIEQGGNYSTGSADITVATWQSLDRSFPRLQKFDREDMMLAIVDEAHHAASPNFLRLLHYFHQEVKLNQVGPFRSVKKTHGHEVPLLGFSATLERVDDYDVRDAFPNFVFNCDIEPLVKKGRLAKMIYTIADAGMNLQKMADDDDDEDEEDEDGSVQVELQGEELDHAKRVDNRIVQHYVSQVVPKDRKHTLVFAANIAHVTRMKEAFKTVGVESQAVTCRTPVDVRVKLLEQFAQGAFPLLINCGVFAEGTDIPCIDCLFIARPTRSPILMTQMVGRGMRVSPATGKKDCLIVDFTCSEKTGLHISPAFAHLTLGKATSGY